MPVPVTTMVRGVRSQLDDLMYAPVGIMAMAELERELTPILAELVTLGPGNDQHPAVKQLFNWLVDPKCTVEEFNYVVGPLGRHVDKIMKDNFGHYICEQYIGCSIYLAKVAAEALAVKNPVLQGLWEHAALFVIRLAPNYDSQSFGFVSDHLRDWIFRVSRDAGLCPNAYLRIELITQLPYLVDVNEHSQECALESLMTACSALDLNYITECSSDQDEDLYLDAITKTLTLFTADYLKCVDQKLVKKLKDLKKNRLSTIFHDVTFKYRINPRRYMEPMELQALAALLKTIAEYAQFQLMKFKKNCRYPGWLYVLSNMLNVLFTNFAYTCQMVHLSSETASCIMNVLELVLTVNVARLPDRRKIPLQGAIGIEMALKRLCNVHNIIIGCTAPASREIKCRYNGRLRAMEEMLKHFNLDSFPMICNLVYNDCLDV